MKISLNWLNEFIEIPWSAEELAERLTLLGFEAESVEPILCTPDKVIVGKILEIKKHPQADKLTICQVDVRSEKLQIVCGAKNMKEGDLVPVALIGAQLPNGLSIKKGKLRGVESFGMMCSSQELLMAEESDGLLILTEEFSVGDSLTEKLPISDTLFEIGITPNRGDCLSHLGLAREVAALLEKPLKLPSTEIVEAKEKSADFIKVAIEDSDCLRYTARVIQDVEIKPSPLKIQMRLTRCGIRPINNVVDITNYCLLELGQPLHAFDLDCLDGEQINIRKADKKEKLVTLDDKERSLDPSFLVIADKKKPVALAGVMGGKEAEVSHKTTSLLLESAYFSPVRVRQMSRKVSLSSESSYRFERGVDILNVELASKRAAKLLQDFAGGKILKGVVDQAEAITPKKIDLRLSRISRILGCEIAKSKVQTILEGLEIQVTPKGKEGFTTQIPLHRHDLNREIDLIEEIVRFYGTDKVPTTHPQIEVYPVVLSPEQELSRRLSEAAIGLGFYQVLNYSFISKKDLVPYFIEASDFEKETLALLNPVTEDLKYMRPRLLPSLLRTAQYNLARENKEIRFFEIGSTYHPNKGKGSLEKKSFTLVMTASEIKANWKEKDLSIDFYDVKGISESLLNSLNLFDLKMTPLKDGAYHPGQSGVWEYQNKPIACVGQVHPLALKHFSIETPLYAIEIFLDQVPFIREGLEKLNPIPKFPKVSRDIALVLPESLPEQEVRDVFSTIKSPLLESFSLFDVYHGPQVPEGKKSLAYSLHYRSQDDTLTDEVVEVEHQKICQLLTKKLGCEFRA